jgi:hypothetical protein
VSQYRRGEDLSSSCTSARRWCFPLRLSRSRRAAAGARLRRSVPGTLGSPSGYLIVHMMNLQISELIMMQN